MGLLLGTRRTLMGAETVNRWWLSGGASGAVGAYQAKSAVSYAASKVNLANPGTYDLSEGNGALPWAALTGWGFVSASAQWLDTGLVPANDQSWSILIQFNNFVWLADFAALAGCSSGANRYFWIEPGRTNAQVLYTNGRLVLVAPQLNNGNLGVAGNQGYRNGIADGGLMSGWVGTSTKSIYIGASQEAVASYFIDANIESVAIYNGTLTAPQVLAVATAMAAL